MEWNLYLEERARYYRLIMPDHAGRLSAPAPKKGYAVKWPLNPHFTGPRMIARLILLSPAPEIEKPIQIDIGGVLEIVHKGD